MTNVISLRPDVPGEQSFLCCPCQSGDEHPGFAPVVIHDAAGVFISSLICLGCESEVSIVNGRPVTE